ncbi:MAG: hypothetical protein AAF891_11010 [Pseudomonadota bacterium]
MQLALNHITAARVTVATLFEMAQALGAVGYGGAVSLEAFAPEVQAMDDPLPSLSQTFAFMTGQDARTAA